MMASRAAWLLSSVAFVGSAVSLPNVARAWENHAGITRGALQAYEGWEPAPYEPIEKVLPDLKVAHGSPASTLAQFSEQLAIRQAKVKWDWQPPTAADGAPPDGFDVLLFSVSEPDAGMDQDLNVTPDQKYMGGFQGPSSQGFRHMHYRGWTPAAPLRTFHFPPREMGDAPERASLYFDLASQARTAGHPFWSYRFLGWGLHYVQDLGQPYHASQFASFRLLPLRVLLSVGWEPFVLESRRIVGNFHLSFERYADYLLRPERDSRLLMAFKVPRGDQELKLLLEQKLDLPVRDASKRLALSSESLASDVAKAQLAYMGDVLLEPSLNLIAGFYDGSGRPKIDLARLDTDGARAQARKNVYSGMEAALSNTGVATRWYVDKFRAIPADMK